MTELFRRAHPARRCVTLDVRRRHRRRAGSAARARARQGSRPWSCCATSTPERASAGTGWSRSWWSCADTTRVSVAATVVQGAGGTGCRTRRCCHHFDRCVTLPPLRFRADDLSALVDRTLRELAPGRTVRLSPEASRMVIRHSWPGNLSPAAPGAGHRADPSAGRRAPGRRPPRLLPHDQHPHADPVGGRRAGRAGDHAARAGRQPGAGRSPASGMSRSSLYRKLARYGITGL